MNSHIHSHIQFHYYLNKREIILLNRLFSIEGTDNSIPTISNHRVNVCASIDLSYLIDVKTLNF